jgi:tellurite resistance protein TerC
MDLIFSIDNVIAAVSLSNEIWVVMLGVGIGILTMRFAAGWFSYAVEREPILKPAAYVLIFNIGIQLILEQLLGLEITDPVKFLISITIILSAVFYAHNRFLQKFKPMLYGLSYLFGVINKAVDLLFLPFKLFFQFLVNGRSIPNPEETK